MPTSVLCRWWLLKKYCEVKFPSASASPLSFPFFFFPPLLRYLINLARSLGERCKLPQRVRTEPGRQIVSGAFSAKSRISRHNCVQECDADFWQWTQLLHRHSEGGAYGSVFYFILLSCNLHIHVNVALSCKHVLQNSVYILCNKLTKTLPPPVNIRGWKSQ